MSETASDVRYNMRLACHAYAMYVCVFVCVKVARTQLLPLQKPLFLGGLFNKRKQFMQLCYEVLCSH